jgi:hypothetical protein
MPQAMGWVDVPLTPRLRPVGLRPSSLFQRDGNEAQKARLSMF